MTCFITIQNHSQLWGTTDPTFGGMHLKNVEYILKDLEIIQKNLEIVLKNLEFIFEKIGKKLEKAVATGNLLQRHVG